jgi:CheY-like chemotaxis protein
VISVASSADALAFMDAAHAHELPHAIVIEVPDEGDAGQWLIRELDGRSEVHGSGAIPVIAVISHEHARQRKRVLAAGFRSHLSKPLSPQKLAAAVLSVVGR